MTLPDMRLVVVLTGVLSAFLCPIWGFLVPGTGPERHAYERMHNVFNNKTDISGPVYINIGDAGNREGHCPDYYPQPSWSAYGNLLLYFSIFGPFLAHFSAPPHPTRAVRYELLSSRATGC